MIWGGWVFAIYSAISKGGMTGNCGDVILMPPRFQGFHTINSLDPGSCDGHFYTKKCLEILPSQQIWITSSDQQQVACNPWKQEKLGRKHVWIVVSTVPADALALLGARASAGTVLTKIGFWVKNS